MDNMQKISLIIPTMNRLESFVDSIEYLMKSTYLPDEIIVVDQSEQTISRAICELIDTLPVEARYFHRAPSLTAARNFAFHQAKNDILIFMDDDVRVKPNTIYEVSEHMKDSSIAMIGALNENHSNRTNDFGYLFGKKSYRKRSFGHVSGAIFGRYPARVLDEVHTHWAMGYFFVIRKSLVQKWNLNWDEHFVSYAYAEDLDFSYRYFHHAVAENLRCILTPKICVAHMQSTEWRESPRKATLMLVIHREYLTYKWKLGPVSRLKTRWANFGIFIERLIHRDRPFDVLFAQLYCDRYRRDIKKGILHTELFQK